MHSENLIRNAFNLAFHSQGSVTYNDVMFFTSWERDLFARFLKDIAEQREKQMAKAYK